MESAGELKPRTYYDLLAIWDAMPDWHPPDDDAQAGDRPTLASGAAMSDRDIDLFTDRQIAEALQIDVLGQHEDGEIEVYSSFLRRTVRFSSLSRLKMDDMLRLFGTPARKVVSRTNEDAAPGMYPIRCVREAIGHLASVRLIGEETKLGPGVWPISNENGKDQSAVVLVNADEALHWNGRHERITHPRHHGHLLAFDSATNPWYEHDELLGMLEQARDKAWRAAVSDDLVNLFSRWRWKGKHDALIVSGLVMATWVQAVWAWRPRIDVLGESGTGKSMLCEALGGLFRDLVISTADTSFAGLAQEMQRQMAAVIVDEMDAKDKESKLRQRAIIKGLRSASRGTMRIRGTGSQKATRFVLRHLPWIAGISLNYDDQADRNRAVVLNLLPATREMAGKLTLPSSEDLHSLGQRSLACALLCVQEARCLAVALKNQRVEGADQRQVESYAVPAAMLACVLGIDRDAPALLASLLDDARFDQPGESDQVTLVKEILGATIQLGQYRLTVGQAIEYVMDLSKSGRDEWRTALELAGIKLELAANPKIILRYQAVKAKLLRGTRWGEDAIDQFLKRVPLESDCTRRSIGGVQGRCIAFDLRAFAEMFIQDEQPEVAEAREF